MGREERGGGAGQVAVFERVAREVLTAQVTLEQRFGGGNELCSCLGEGAPRGGKSSCKGPGVGMYQLVFEDLQEGRYG